MQCSPHWDVAASDEFQTDIRPTREKRESLATRRLFQKRADRYIAPELRHETAERVIRAVVKRIEWPRYGAPLSLSATDKTDALGAGMLACVQAGFFHHGFMTLHVIRSIRNAIQGPACLRLRRNWESLTADPAQVAAEAGFLTEDETVSRTLTQGQRDVAKEIMRTLRAARLRDKGRKSAANFASQRGFFFIILGEITERTPRSMAGDAFRQRTRRFLDYLASGAEALRATRRPPNLAAEIMTALAARALA